MKPDIIASIRFLSPIEGGRATLPSGATLACIFELQGQSFDCRLQLEEASRTSTSEFSLVPISFLFPDEALSCVRKGGKFRLRDHRVIAEGVVDEVGERVESAAPHWSAKSR